MNDREIIIKTQDVFRIIFDDPSLKITEDTSLEDIGGWDSLNHINLVLAISREFNVRFSLEDIQSLVSVRAILDTIKKLKGSIKDGD